MRYEYDTVLHETPDSGGAYVTFPWDIRGEFGAGRVKVLGRKTVAAPEATDHCALVVEAEFSDAAAPDGGKRLK